MFRENSPTPSNYLFAIDTQSVTTDKSNPKKKRRKKKSRKPKTVKAANISPAEESILNRIPVGLAALISTMKSPPESDSEGDGQAIVKIMENKNRAAEVHKLYQPTDYGQMDDDGSIVSEVDLNQDQIKLDTQKVEEVDERSMQDFIYKPEEEEQGEATEHQSSCKPFEFEDEAKKVYLPKGHDKEKKMAKGKANVHSSDPNVYDYRDFINKVKENPINSIEMIDCEVPSVCLDMVNIDNDHDKSENVPDKTLDEEGSTLLQNNAELKIDSPQTEPCNGEYNTSNDINTINLNNYVKSVLQVDEGDHPEELDPDDISKLGPPDEFPFDLTGEDKSVGKDGDLLIPDVISEGEFEATWLPMTSQPRPYIDANIYGVYETKVLIDSGSCINALNAETYDVIKARLAEKGLTMPKCSSDIAIKCFGGRVVENNEVVLLNIRFGEVTTRNLPFLVVNADGVSQGVLLGAPFLNLTESSLTYSTAENGGCTLRLGTSDPSRNQVIKAEMVGNRQRIQTAETIQVMPRAIKVVKARFEETYGIETSLDKSRMIFQSGELEALLGNDQAQAVYPHQGYMDITLSNTSNAPVTIFNDQEIGSVITQEGMNNAIDLSLMRASINVVDLSTRRVINCLCPDKIGTNVGIIYTLDRDDFSLLGPDTERMSPWDVQKSRKESKRISARGNQLWIRTNQEANQESVSQSDLDAIAAQFPLSMYKEILVPYKIGLTINMYNIRAIQELRKMGYKVSVCAFTPTIPVKGENGEVDQPCERCVQGSLNGLMSDREKYKITNVELVFPTSSRQIPDGFNTKIQGTRVARFKFWQWTLDYYLKDANTVAMIVHMPSVYTKYEDQVKNHALLLFKYLKVSFPKSKITVSSMFPKSTGANVMWVEPLKQAFEAARYYRDYYDSSIGNPRKRKAKHAVEKFNFTDSSCACYFCDSKQEPKPAENVIIISENWRLDPFWENKIKEYQKIIRKDQPKAPVKKTEKVTVLDIMSVQGTDNTFKNFIIDPIEMIDICVRSADRSEDPQNDDEILCPESTMDVGSIHFHCQGDGNCADRREEVFLKTEPTVPDRVQAGNDPANHFEAKAPILDIREHVKMNHLTEEQQGWLVKVLDKHHNVLSISSDDRRYIKNHYLSFNVKEPVEGFYIKPYPMSNALIEEYMRHFDNLVEKGFCTRDLGQRIPEILMYSPSFLVYKNAASRDSEKPLFRLVSDFSRVNQLITTSDRGDAVPAVEDLIQEIANTRFTSVADASNFFPSFRISTRTQRYMGLSAPKGYTPLVSMVAMLGISVWPGLSHVASRCMLRKDLKSRISQYIDDFSIQSRGERYPICKEFSEAIGKGEGLTEDFMEHLQIIDHFLTDADHFGILISANKFQVFCSTFSYLGMNIEKGGKISIPAEKIKILENFDVDNPNITPKDIQSLLGLLNYLSASIDSYSAKVYLLHLKAAEKTPPGKKFELHPIHKALIRELIEDVKRAPKRHIYNSSLPLHIYCDSSLFAMGMIALQYCPETQRYLFVRAASWRHSEHDLRNLPAILKETACLLKILRTFPQYFQNQSPELKTRIHTDQRTIRELLKNHQLNSPNLKISRWLTTIANMPLWFEFDWVPNTHPILKIADTLSRDPRLDRRTYVMRFSNKERKNSGWDFEEKDRPVWNGPTSDEDIRRFLKQYDLIKFPKTNKLRIPVQDQEKKTWEQDDDFSAEPMRYFLPRISWPSREAPRADSTYVKRPGSVKTQDSSIKSGDEGSNCEEDVTAGNTHNPVRGSICYLEGNKKKRVPRLVHCENLGPHCDEDCVTDRTFCGHRTENLQRAMIEVMPILLSTPHMQTQLRHSIQGMEKIPITLNILARNQRRDNKLASIIDDLMTGKPKKQNSDKYYLYESNVLCKIGRDGASRICLDFQSLLILTAWIHLFSHAGISSTFKSLNTYYTSNFMTQAVRGIIETCVVCKYGKPKLTRKDCMEGVSYKPQSAFEHISLDHMKMNGPGSDKYPYVLVMVDPATRYIFAFPVKTTGMLETAKMLSILFSWFPKIKSISSDNATGLIRSDAVRKVCRDFDVRTITRLPSVPTASAITERAVQTLRKLFRLVRIFKKSKSYLDDIPYVVRIVNYNFRRYYTIQEGKIRPYWTSPMALVFNFEGRMKLRELMGERNLDMPKRQQELWRKQIKEATNAFNADKREVQRQIDEAYIPKIQKGDLVLLKNTRPEDRKESTYKLNIYKVISRKNRKAQIQPIFGTAESRSSLYDAYVGHLTKFSQSELVKHLPKEYQDALGYEIEKGDPEGKPKILRNYNQTEKGKQERKIQIASRRMRKQGLIGVPSSSSSSSASEEANMTPSVTSASKSHSSNKLKFTGEEGREKPQISPKRAFREGKAGEGRERDGGKGAPRRARRRAAGRKEESTDSDWLSVPNSVGPGQQPRKGGALKKLKGFFKRKKY